MKLNPDNCHLVLSHSDIKPINLGSLTIENTKSEQLIDVIFDFETRLKSHIEDLCYEASRRLYGLARIDPYMDLRKKEL